MESNNDKQNLIEENTTNSTTDIITDLKTGIYNLFVNLFHSYIPFYGLDGAIQASTSFLEEIVVNFKNTLNDNQVENQEKN